MIVFPFRFGNIIVVYYFVGEVEESYRFRVRMNELDLAPPALSTKRCQELLLLLRARLRKALCRSNAFLGDQAA